MFERFTNQARRVVVLAQEESRILNHNYIGTEHLVLGLLHEGRGTGAQALESVGITLEAVRREVESRVGQGNEQPTGHIPFTPRAKKSLELSLRESLALGQNYIGTGHLLLGLLRKGDGVGVEVLVSLGADLNAVRGRVIELLNDDAERESVPQERSRPQRVEREPGSVLTLLDTIDTRLSAIERHLGLTRPVPRELRVLDQRIAKVAGAKEEAIERQDFEEAASLRDQEKQLRAERARLSKELERASRAEAAGMVPASAAAPESRTGPEQAGGGAPVGEGMVTGQGALTGEGAVTAEGPDEGLVTGEEPVAVEGTSEGPGTGQSEVTAAGPDEGLVMGEEPVAVEGPEEGPVTGKEPVMGEVGEGRLGGVSDEVARLRAEVARLTALLREHDIDLGKPQEPPAAAG